MRLCGTSVRRLLLDEFFGGMLLRGSNLGRRILIGKRPSQSVIPAKAGIQCGHEPWTPAFAGATALQSGQAPVRQHSSERGDSFRCLSDVDVAVKRLEKDFRSTTIDVSCNALVDLNAELASLGPFVLDYRYTSGR